MGWLEALERRAREAVGSVPVASTPARQPAKPRSNPVIKSVWVQTAAPIGPRDPGAAEPAFYFVSDGELTLCDENGKPTRHTHQLKPDEDPRRIAGRLKKAAMALTHSDFNRALNYPTVGVA
jgi:hypothetical protein